MSSYKVNRENKTFAVLLLCTFVIFVLLIATGKYWNFYTPIISNFFFILFLNQYFNYFKKFN